MKLIFLLALLICFVTSYLYFTNVLAYGVAMPIIVSCLTIVSAEKAFKAYQIKNTRAFGIFGLAALLGATFVITTLLGII